MKNLLAIALCLLSVLYSYSQESQQNLIFTGTSIEDVMEFEAKLNSKTKKSFATIVLAPELYPHVDKYELGNPKQISRIQPAKFPANVEYFYDVSSQEVKYLSYKWAFMTRIGDDVLFNKKKLRELVEKECGELETYSKLFSELEEVINDRYASSKKTVLKNESKNRLIEWENENSKAILKLEFQDCSDEKHLLPGWFMVGFTEYSK